MKMPFHSRSKPLRFLGVVLSLAMGLGAYGALLVPVTAAAAENPVVAQEPLTVQPSVPPNIVLMLDDSGSMRWDIMPDWDYLPIPDWDNLKGQSLHFNADGFTLNDEAELPLIDSLFNGTYYNPAVTYAPPPEADGTSYPDATFSAAWINGFDSSGTTVDIATYRGKYDTNDETYAGSNVAYSVPIAKDGATSYDPTRDCSSTDGPSTTYAGYCYYEEDGFDYSTTVSFFDKNAGGSGDFYVSRCNSISDVYHYNGDLDSDFCVPGISFFTYAVATQVDVAAPPSGAYAASADCPDHTKRSGSQNGYCYYNDPGYDPPPSGTRVDFEGGSGPYYYVSRCNEGDVYNQSNDQCYPASSVTLSTSTCGSGLGRAGTTLIDYDTSRDICIANSSVTDPSTLPTGTLVGATYVEHYVGENSGDCAAAGLSPSVCVDPGQTTISDPSVQSGMTAAQVLQNIANWFSYYHTRILMAKSGLMNGFSGLSSTYRLGFGSINGQNNDELPSPKQWFGGGYDSKEIAEVQPFGDGSSGTQKANFWNWVATMQPGSSTPLRAALDAVGEYYGSSSNDPSDSQPWESTSDDPGYVAGGTNSPIACRAAYTILTTDGFWNGGFSSSTIAGASDRDGTTVTGPNSNSYTYSADAPYSGGGTGDSDSPSLADVATYFWETDLQPDINNEVPTSTEDPAFWQHMTTFTMGMGFTPVNISPSGTTVDQIFDWANGSTAISSFNWPTPSPDDGGSDNNIADLAHAAVNGHGGFYSATNPQSFAAGIKSALKRVQERVGTGASLAANSTSLNTGTVIYQAIYKTSVWQGDLEAFPVNTNGSIQTSPTWQSSEHIPGASGRDIETYNPVTDTFYPFDTGDLTNLSSAQQAALGSSTTEQDAIIEYLRGDSSNEEQNTGSYRNRDTALGDIVHSQPVYVGPPNPNEFVNQSFLGVTGDSSGDIPFYDWAVGSTNASGTFVASDASQRKPVVYVAANDGMLHAFNAGTGDVTLTNGTVVPPGGEVYAYLPGAVITTGIKDLADPDYGSDADPHQYFNDGQLTIADAYVALSQEGESTPSWHTILVGTTGRGLAKAIYALDVTNPLDIVPLWERSAGDTAHTGDSVTAGATDPNAHDYIGQIDGKPVIAQTSYTPKSGSATASSTWSVLIGNGYNSAAGVAALLQINLATGDMHVHTTTDTSSGNGLAAPVAWMDVPSNGVSDIAYAGDLHGQVWSFALNDSTGSNPTPTSTGTLLFTTEDPDGNPQPITAGMLAGKNPDTGNVWLFFGTGQYLSDSDLTNTNTETWYGIIVQSSDSSLVSNLLNTSWRGSNVLTQRTISEQTTGGGTTLPARAVSSEVVNSDGTTDMTGKSGWYLDLLAPVGTGGAPVQQGERMVDPNEFRGSVLIGVTLVPLVSDVCNPSGTGWFMALDPFTGTAPKSDFFDVNGDGIVDANDKISGSGGGTSSTAAGVGYSSTPNLPIFAGNVAEISFKNGGHGNLPTGGGGGSAKRVSWRELVAQ